MSFVCLKIETCSWKAILNPQSPVAGKWHHRTEDWIWIHDQHLGWRLEIWPTAPTCGSILAWFLGPPSMLTDFLELTLCIKTNLWWKLWHVMHLFSKDTQQNNSGPIQQISDHFNPGQLPMRELPHGNVANLYLLFTAWCKAKTEGTPGRSTFYKVYKEWSQRLRFHKKKVHTQCAKHVLKSDQRFMLRMMLALTSYTFFYLLCVACLTPAT